MIMIYQAKGIWVHQQRLALRNIILVQGLDFFQTLISNLDWMSPYHEIDSHSDSHSCQDLELSMFRTHPLLIFPVNIFLFLSAKMYNHISHSHMCRDLEPDSSTCQKFFMRF